MNRNQQHIELRNEHVQDLLEAMPHWMIRFGNLLILILVVLLFILSWFIKYPDIITSEVEIFTKILSQQKFAKTSGTFDSFFVSNNDYVKKGDVLAIIESTAKYEDIKLLKSVIDSIQFNSDTFNFPIDNIPILFLGDIDVDYTSFENSFIQYQLNKELEPYENEQQRRHVSKKLLYARLNILKDQKQLIKKELSYLKTNLDRQQQLYSKGVIAKQTLELKEMDYMNVQRNYKELDASIIQIKDAINNVSTNETTTTIKKTKEDVRLLKRVIQSFNQLKRAIKNWELQYVITSDINGRVIFSESWTNNQHINEGELVCTIIPEENTSYIAKLQSPRQNSSKIKIGQTVNISIENYPEAVYGSIKGQVEFIPLLTNKNGFYDIDVSLPKKLISSYGKQVQFKHGMRGQAKIITEDLRLIERLFYRVKSVFKN